MQNTKNNNSISNLLNVFLIIGSIKKKIASKHIQIARFVRPIVSNQKEFSSLSRRLRKPANTHISEAVSAYKMASTTWSYLYLKQNTWTSFSKFQIFKQCVRRAGIFTISYKKECKPNIYSKLLCPWKKFTFDLGEEYWIFYSQRVITDFPSTVHI